MAQAASNGESVEIVCSGAIAKALRQIQQQATSEGRGEAVLSAIRIIHSRLEKDAASFGEPRYRLPILRLNVRQAVVGPLAVEFAVHDDKPIVFIKGVKLLGRGKK
jgi:hypothetical protein